MRFAIRIRVALALIALIGLAGCQNNAAIATIDGTRITVEQFQERVAFDSFIRTAGSATDPATVDSQQIGQLVLDTMIDEIIVRGKAEAAGLTVTPDEYTAESQTLFGSGGMAQIVLITVRNTGLDEDRVRSLWEDQVNGLVLSTKLELAQNFPVDATQPTVHAAHIVVASRAEAEAVLARISAGESFDALASELSIDELTADRGGDLGWIRVGQTVPTFEAGLFDLAVGEYGVVQSQYGWHVVTVLERSEEPATPERQQQQRDAQFQALIKQWRDEAQIDIRPDWQDFIPETPTP